MKYLKFVSALALALICLQFPAFSQKDTTTLKNIIKKTTKLPELYPVEKVYLHFDKPYYSVVDTIWFKAYLTSDQNMPSNLSKIVYVDVMNSQDSLIASVKFPVANSVAYGNIPLNPLNFKQGNYYVRAYTVWMMNFDPDYFFTKNIAIGEAVDKQLLTHFSYTTSTSNKDQQLINARVQYKNPDKIAYANKTVNWKVISDYDVILKGKATTDQNGVLNINISPKKNQIITNGTLVTDISVADKENLHASFELKPKTGENDLQFFPEGGELIAGIPAQVGFKALKPDGLGIELSGSITDSEGNQITTFNSSHAGMGAFYINADLNKTYIAKINFKDGSSKSLNLPKASPSGVSLQVNNSSPEVVNLKIVANENYFQQNKDKNLFIIGQNAGVIYYAAQTTLQNQVTIAKIPKNKFPSGIVQLTLFASNGEPVSERLAFILHKDALNLSLQTDLPAYKARQKVKMTLTAKNATEKLVGNFSVSVTDEQKVPANEDNETTILSSLLLSSDLKGYLEKPNYYFNKTDDKKLADLDVLMLTQGYRRFSFKDILADKYPLITYLPEQGMNITGTLRDRTGMPVKKAPLRLTIPGRTYAAEALTSPSGIFNFQNLNFPDSSQVVISAKYGSNGSNLMIMVDQEALPAVSKNKNVVDQIINIDSTMNNYLNNSKKQYSYLRQLKEVVIQGAAIKKVSHADYSSLTGLQTYPDHLLEAARFNGCNDLLTCLKTMAMGMTYDNSTNSFYVTRSYNTGNRTPVQIFLGGMPVDALGLSTVNMTELESIEIFLKDDLGTVNRIYNSNGVISVNIKKPQKVKKMSLDEIKKLLPQSGVMTISPKGYSREREFYSPKYTATNLNMKDLRSTIYWNPRIVTDATGTFSFEFFNAEGKGTYKAVVEGLDKNGNPGRFVYRYTVK
jgi:hypothetical protein